MQFQLYQTEIDYLIPILSLYDINVAYRNQVINIMPASRKQRTIYMSDARKERLMKLDPEASFSQLVNRAVSHYYDALVEDRWLKKQRREKFKKF